MNETQRARFEILMTAAVDGELDPEGREELDEILRLRPEWRGELEDHRRIREVVGTMQFVKPPEEFWDRYHRKVLHRLERSIGWVLVVVGLGLLLGYGGALGLLELVQDTEVPFWVKVGVTASLGGFAILLISIIRERLTLRTRERYDEVQR